MARKKSARSLTALILSLALCASAASPAYAQEVKVQTSGGEDTFTYYFLAPDNYFNTEKGAANDKVGAYWWQPSEPAGWPGVEMTAAPEVGQNVYKIEGMTESTANIIFNSFPQDGEADNVKFQTSDINTEGYDDDCPYDKTITTENFDGWIYVLSMDNVASNDFSGASVTGGAWFKLDDYKNYDAYYGSYGFPEEPKGMTYYFLAPDNYFDTEKGAANDKVGAYWWQPEQPADWPGVEMTAAPEVGQNVYKVEGMSADTANIIFNSFPSDADADDQKHQTTDINTEGYDEDCPYDETLATENFDGWIYVLSMADVGEGDFSGAVTTGGAWFKLDDYKNYDEYYGSYGFPKESTGMTYYFLAPDNYFNTEKGAANDKVGAYWWQPEQPADWPGIEMTAAPEVGENVFKVEGMSADTANIIFNSFPSDADADDQKHQTTDINTEGYDADCPYDDSIVTDNFDGWIYVLSMADVGEGDFSGAVTTGGAWFKLSDYKNYDEYYGSYFNQPEPEDPTKPKGSAAGTIAYKAGEEFDFTIKFGNIKEGKIAAFNYDIYYDPEFVEPVLNEKGKIVKEDFTQADEAPMLVINTGNEGSVQIGFTAQDGIDNDVSGDPVDLFKFKFKVKKDASKLGITGVCKNLSLIVDGTQQALLGPSTETEDTFSSFDVPEGNPEIPPVVDTKYTVGQVVDTAVKIGNVTGGRVGSYNYVITYDPELVEVTDYTDLATAEDPSTMLTVVNTATPGIIKIGMVAVTGITNDTTGDPVDLLTVKFTVKQNTDVLGVSGKCTALSVIPADGSTPVKIYSEGADVADSFTHLAIPGEEPTPATPDVPTPDVPTPDTPTPDVPTPGPGDDNPPTPGPGDDNPPTPGPGDDNPPKPIEDKFVYGDMDNDGYITSADALKILRMSVKLDPVTDQNKKIADVDVDDNITSADALDVLRFSVKLSNNKLIKESLEKYGHTA